MNEESLNMSVRKFLKKVGVTSQREIEIAVRDALESGSIQGDERFPVRVTLEVEGLKIRHEVDGEIHLE